MNKTWTICVDCHHASTEHYPVCVKCGGAVVFAEEVGKG